MIDLKGCQAGPLLTRLSFVRSGWGSNSRVSSWGKGSQSAVRLAKMTEDACLFFPLMVVTWVSKRSGCISIPFGPELFES